MSTGSAQPFTPSGTVTIAATNSSSTSAALPGTGDAILVFNSASVVALVAVGLGAATATAGSFPVPPGATRLIGVGPIVNTVAVLLAASGSGNVYASSGVGSVY